jgi:hypothetical protein
VEVVFEDFDNDEAPASALIGSFGVELFDEVDRAADGDVGCS